MRWSFVHGRARRAIAAPLLTLLLLAAGATAARAETVATGFRDVVAMSGLTEPTSVRFATDGRIFVAQKDGVIKVFHGLSDTHPVTFADMRTEVDDYWDRGLLGLALDPNFPASPYVYALYTRDAGPGQTPPRWNDACPTPPGPTDDGCVVTGRLVRLTATGDTATATKVLVDDWCQQFPSHSIGELKFGPDGALYASGGDGASFNTADYGQYGTPKNPCGDPPTGSGGTQTPPTAEGGALRSQDVRTTSDPTDLNGAIIRIDPATGLGLPDNPLAASSDANARRIAAYGLRNPFRFTVRPGTNEVWAADVGYSTWEEIDRITSPTSGPANYGWPCYEGAARQPAYDNLDLSLCESLYQTPNAVTDPYYAYNHNAKVVSGESCPSGSSSISGIAFYNAAAFPASYAGALFFADYSRNCIWAMLPGSNGLPDPTRIQTFAAGAAGPVNLEVGPDGNVYYPDLDGGTIHRLESTDSAPTAVAAATPTSGSAPLTVAFDGTGSSDPDAGDTLSYAWDLDGNGSYETTGSKPSFTYSTAGAHTATLKVTDSHGVSNTDPVTITVGTPPTAQITSPAATLHWKVNDTISFSGSATDKEDGNLPASALTWSVILHHCPGDGTTCHTHPVQDITGVSSGSFTAPDHEYPSYLEIRLTARDSTGLTDTQSVRLDPQTVDLSFASSPTGLQLTAGTTTATAPFTKTVIVGSRTTLTAPTSQTSGSSTYSFSSWSDGGARSHDVIAPASPASYTATYAAATCSPRSSSYSAAVTGTTGLVGYWRLGEASGSVACASAGPNGGYSSGGATLGQPGAIAGDPDTSIALNGSSGFVSVPDAAALNSARVSMEAWVRPTSVAGSQAIARKDGQFYLKLYDGKLQLWLWSSPTAWTRITTAAAVMTAGAWQHVVATYDGATARIYRNGAQVASQAVTLTIPTTANPLRWGDALTGGLDQNFLGGGLDEAALYNTALTAAQVTSHYNAGTTVPATKPAAPTGLTATAGAGQVSLSWARGTGGTTPTGYRVYRRTGTTGTFTFDGTSSVTSYTDGGLTGGTTYTYYVTAVDSTGAESDPSATASATPPVAGACSPRSSSYSAAVTGTAGLVGYWRLGDASGSVACATTGPNGSYSSSGVTLGQPGGIARDPDTSIALDGAAGFVSVADAAALHSTRISLEAWVRPATVAGSQSIVRKDGQYYLKIYDGKLQLWLWSGVNTWTRITTAATVMTAGAWQHVVVTYDGATARIYRNGAQVASQAVALTIPTSSDPLRWGDALTGGSDQNFLGGNLDEAALYNTALTAAQVTSHYNAGL